MKKHAFPRRLYLPGLGLVLALVAGCPRPSAVTVPSGRRASVAPEARPAAPAVRVRPEAPVHRARPVTVTPRSVSRPAGPSGLPKIAFSPGQTRWLKVGKLVTVVGVAGPGRGRRCTAMHCGPSRPCCNRCNGPLVLRGKHAEIRLCGKTGRGYGCSGKSCAMRCSPLAAGGRYRVYGEIVSRGVLRVINATRLKAQPKDAVTSYRACGCGCCGGAPNPRSLCLYRSRGDDIGEIMKRDAVARGRKQCALVGCARGTTYMYCD